MYQPRGSTEKHRTLMLNGLSERVTNIGSSLPGWPPADLSCHNVGAAGVGVINLREAPLVSFFFASPEFQCMFDIEKSLRNVSCRQFCQELLLLLLVSLLSRILCLAKGFSAGFGVDVESTSAAGLGRLRPPPSCKEKLGRCLWDEAVILLGWSKCLCRFR